MGQILSYHVFWGLIPSMFSYRFNWLYRMEKHTCFLQKNSKYSPNSIHMPTCCVGPMPFVFCFYTSCFVPILWCKSRASILNLLCFFSKLSDFKGIDSLWSQWSMLMKFCCGETDWWNLPYSETVVTFAFWILMYSVYVLPLSINLLRPSDAYTRHQTKSWVVQIMVCGLFGARPSSEPVLSHYQLHHWELYFRDISFKIN